MNLFTRAGAALTLVLAALLFSQQAFAQGTVLQSGPITGRHAPMYVGGFGGNSQAILMDSGPASGGANGLGVSEWLQQSGNPNGGTAVAPSSGTGPFGTHVSLWDTYSANPTGAHFLSFDANANGGGLIAYGATGTASQLPLSICANGQCIQFPFVISGILGPSSSVIGDCAVWNNTAGTLLKDSGPCPPISLAINAVSGVPTVTANSPLNGIYASSAGSQVPYCNTGITFGCTIPANFTSQFFDVMTTSHPASVSENGLLTIVYNTSGQRQPWFTGTVYTANVSYVLSSGNIYVATTNGTSGPTAPSGTGTPFDGGVNWSYQGPGFESAKQAVNFNILNGPGGGASWAGTFDNVIQAGWDSYFATALEVDTSNGSSNDPAPGGQRNFLELYLGGNAGPNPITAQIYMGISPGCGGCWGTHYGMWVLGTTIKDYDVVLSTIGSTGGLLTSGTFTQAAVIDSSTSSIGFDLAGTHSNAGIFMSPTGGSDIEFGGSGTQIGLNAGNTAFGVSFISDTNMTTALTAMDFAGTYATAVLFMGAATAPNMIMSPNFALSNVGKVTAASYAAGASNGLSCSGAPTGSFATVNGIVTHC